MLVAMSQREMLGFVIPQMAPPEWAGAAKLPKLAGELAMELHVWVAICQR